MESIQAFGELSEKKVDIKPYHVIRPLQPHEHETLQQFLDEPQVEIYYDLNNETDYAVQWQDGDKVRIARVSECVTINGVRWHLIPGKNLVPKSVYEYIQSIPDMRKHMSIKPGSYSNLGRFK